MSICCLQALLHTHYSAPYQKCPISVISQLKQEKNRFDDGAKLVKNSAWYLTLKVLASELPISRIQNLFIALHIKVSTLTWQSKHFNIAC